MRCQNEIKSILFDMDGVLADVTHSYREAIIHTAKYYNVNISNEDITREKNKGNANNDWILTHKLILESIEDKYILSLKNVTERFEIFYQGTEVENGFRMLESCIPSKGLLEELYERCNGKLAIVTGRPKKDCLFFLNKFNLKDLFPVIVCMEDGPLKPNQFPILKAIELLNVQPNEVMMIGDTMDDINAAVSANILAFGVYTPDMYAKKILKLDSPLINEYENIMLNAGASKILKPGLNELLDFIPKRSNNTYYVSTTDSSVINRTIQPRIATIERKTKETTISVSINLDGKGDSKINTGIGFLDHMLNACSKHGRLDLNIVCKGDLIIDDHHTTEDIAITFGSAFDKALANRHNIKRFGSSIIPLDESLARSVVDISSRSSSDIHLNLTRQMIGPILSTEMLTHFFESFAQSARLTLHIDVLKGKNDHHKAESAFKAFGIALKEAVSKDMSAGIPSTKDFL